MGLTNGFIIRIINSFGYPLNQIDLCYINNNNIEKLSGSGYNRPEVVLTLGEDPSSYFLYNVPELNFGIAESDWHEVTHISITSGRSSPFKNNILCIIPLNSPLTVHAGEKLKILSVHAGESPSNTGLRFGFYKPSVLNS